MDGRSGAGERRSVADGRALLEGDPARRVQHERVGAGGGGLVVGGRGTKGRETVEVGGRVGGG